MYLFFICRITFQIEHQLVPGVSSLRLYAQVFNPFVITGYSGSDPEVNSNRDNLTTTNNANIAYGVDNRSVPQPRTYTIGLNVSF
ncbi:hypothetical protein D3C78_1515410 [compost metagenome]